VAEAALARLVVVLVGLLVVAAAALAQSAKRVALDLREQLFFNTFQTRKQSFLRRERLGMFLLIGTIMTMQLKPSAVAVGLVM
jgi:uncharacterized membrane protein YesL